MHTPGRLPCGIMLLFALLLQGCGHKGPLTLLHAQPAIQQPSDPQPSMQQPDEAH